MLYDMRRNLTPSRYIANALIEPFRGGGGARSAYHQLVRMVLVLPVFVISRFKQPLEMPVSMLTHADYVDYRERTKGSYVEIMARHGCDSDLSFLSDNAQKIFSAAS